MCSNSSQTNPKLVDNPKDDHEAKVNGRIKDANIDSEGFSYDWYQLENETEKYERQTILLHIFCCPGSDSTQKGFCRLNSKIIGDKKLVWKEVNNKFNHVSTQMVSNAFKADPNMVVKIGGKEQTLGSLCNTVSRQIKNKKTQVSDNNNDMSSNNNRNISLNNNTSLNNGNISSMPSMPSMPSNNDNNISSNNNNGNMSSMPSMPSNNNNNTSLNNGNISSMPSIPSMPSNNDNNISSNNNNNMSSMPSMPSMSTNNNNNNISSMSSMSSMSSNNNNNNMSSMPSNNNNNISSTNNNGNMSSRKRSLSQREDIVKEGETNNVIEPPSKKPKISDTNESIEKNRHQFDLPPSIRLKTPPNLEALLKLQQKNFKKQFIKKYPLIDKDLHKSLLKQGPETSKAVIVAMQQSLDKHKEGKKKLSSETLNIFLRRLRAGILSHGMMCHSEPIFHIEESCTMEYYEKNYHNMSS